MNKSDGRVSDELESSAINLHSTNFPTHEIWRLYTDDSDVYKQETERIADEYISGEQCTSAETRPAQGLDKREENHIGAVKLCGVDIVCLFVDGKERLCLAQISNTLLKDFSYNEIHNRRVALGITCIQCTPVQLEILRRTGAMPISSRRCGLITKREADRLVKSFLDEITPPQFPEGFAFKVYHKCGWGCKGLFYPSRYNSSRAKCIKCVYCQGFFSPNKFIFHYHKTNSTTYKHPDAANFNSWRRHLELCDSKDNESLEHAWEDVKAMFNGGCRKRVYSSVAKSPVCTNTKDELWSIDRFQKPESSAPALVSNHEPSGFIEPTLHPAFPKPCLNGFHSYGEYLRALSLPYMSAWCGGAPAYKPQNMIDGSELSMSLPVNMLMYHNYPGNIRGETTSHLKDDSSSKFYAGLLSGQKRARTKSKTESAIESIASKEKTLFTRKETHTFVPVLEDSVREERNDYQTDERTLTEEEHSQESHSPIGRKVEATPESEKLNTSVSLEIAEPSESNAGKDTTTESQSGKIDLSADDSDISLYSEDRLRELLDKIKQQKTNMKRKMESFHSPDTF